MSILEKDLLLDKSYQCPVCGAAFKSKTVKSGRAKSTGSDLDLRPKYSGIDVAKYEAVVCPECGYGALAKYFAEMTSAQIKRIKEKITPQFIKKEYGRDIYSYEDAIDRYKLAYASALAKEAKASEKAYISLKMAWLMRGMRENLPKEEEDNETKKKELAGQEEKLLQNAASGFMEARMKEDFPMCGMDEFTVDYLLAALYTELEKYEDAIKLISNVIVNREAPTRIREKGKELKEIIGEKSKNKS